MYAVKDLTQIKEKFINTMANKSDRTKASYEKSIIEFTSYMIAEKGEATRLADLKYLDIDDYKNHLENHTYMRGGKEVKYSAATVNAKMAAIKAFFKYMLKREIVENNIAGGVEMAKGKKKMPKTLSMQEAMEVMESIRNSDTEYKERDLAMISVLLNCGIRSAELRNLKIEDVDFDSKVMRVVDGKGGKDRNIALNDGVIRDLNAYLNFRSHIYEEYLFLSSRDTAISESGIKKIVKNILERAGLEGSVHAFRHTAATEYYRATGDIRKVQRLLGHSSINTTQIYAEVYDKDMEDMVNLNLFSN